MDWINTNNIDIVISPEAIYLGAEDDVFVPLPVLLNAVVVGASIGLELSVGCDGVLLDVVGDESID